MRACDHHLPAAESTLHRHSLTCTALRDPQLKALSQLMPSKAFPMLRWTGPLGVGKTVRKAICNKKDQENGKYSDCHPCMVTFMAQSTAEEKRLKAAKKEYCKDKWAEELEYTTAQAGRVDTAEQTVDSFVRNYVPGFVRTGGNMVHDWATDKMGNMLRLRVAIARPD